MKLDGLKRVNITSAQQLDSWLHKHADQTGDVVLVTRTDHAPDKHVGLEHMLRALAAHGWISARSYTLGSTKIGHVVRRG